ncbi:hypothetical protein C7D74_32740, partial [Klebsiella pneumoniae]
MVEDHFVAGRPAWETAGVQMTDDVLPWEQMKPGGMLNGSHSFLAWVVEDHFVAGRPAWETAGVQMTDDVLPWEQMKP